MELNDRRRVINAHWVRFAALKKDLKSSFLFEQFCAFWDWKSFNQIFILRKTTINCLCKAMFETSSTKFVSCDIRRSIRSSSFVAHKCILAMPKRRRIYMTFLSIFSVLHHLYDAKLGIAGFPGFHQPAGSLTRTCKKGGGAAIRDRAGQAWREGWTDRQTDLWSRHRGPAFQPQWEALRLSLAIRGLYFIWHHPLLQLHAECGGTKNPRERQTT